MYWLTVTLCLAAASGQMHCEPRMVPWRQFETIDECKRYAAALIRHPATPVYGPFTCSVAKPDLPPLRAHVTPERWV
jgi:hypothetical protein